MKFRLGLLGCAALAVACGGVREADSGPSLPPGEALVDAAVRYQRISGFGASSAWTLPEVSDELAEQLFSTETGIGLSLLRVRITPEGKTDELVTAQQAARLGVSVWAAPWSPPGEWKTGTNPTNALWGGQLLPEHRKEWAARLAAFAVSMRDAGAPLIALSAQNEPNWTDKWETCLWSQAELTAFVRDDLGPELANAGVGTPILAPETNGWSSLTGYAGPLLSDSAAAKFIGPVATHSYGDGRPFEYSVASQAGKEVWQTEVSDSSTSPDAGMGSALRIASLIHQHLTKAGVSAWHYWWINPVSDRDNSALMLNNELTRRAYALGNFSRFVRPGFVRVQATPVPQVQVEVTAFTDPASGRVAIVLANSASNEQTQNITLTNALATTFTPYVTSASQALDPSAPVAVVAGRVTVQLPALSVTTLVSD